jgi:hypothetical protein
MAIVEAACAGLLVVSTKVGGVPEVLPSDMMLLAEPVPEDLVAALEAALTRVYEVDPVKQHQQVQSGMVTHGCPWLPMDAHGYPWMQGWLYGHLAQDWGIMRYHELFSNIRQLAVVR